ncbi:SANT SWI3, ADA2, N-CoR and TFIIIB'' DNA-binding domains [Teratosphaeria destructans]|uniref:SANT SWI3, ADA2, N-CoR and TFIIIB'' DNA-binding domains n=1 Tax=Teratosphaeria destructans TaxID=418781 RepID=A0A9W7SN87_9PEZI|nr:SANT SWI3, ADA2, N-CoR and TFIIIB'' DNA-binding domains [Teratosphaeria destructans]
MARPYGTSTTKPSAPQGTSARARSTRSRSASLEPDEHAQRQTRQGRKTSQYSTTHLMSIPEPELHTVTEDAVVDELPPTEAVPHEAAAVAVAAAAAAAAAAEDHDEDDEPRRESAGSAISGTTAKTSFSQEEIADLDADIMVDALPNLVAAADQLSALLVPADPNVRPVLWKEIRVQGSKQNKLFNNRIASINAHKDSFGTQTYILPSIALRAFFKVQHVEDVPEGPWRPDSLLYKINMAQMLRTLLVEIGDPLNISVNAWQDLEHLETYFPRAISGPDFDMEAVKTCLGIQTQLAIARLQAYSATPNFNPIQTIEDTFFDRSVEGSLVYKFIESLSTGQMDPDDEMMQTVFDDMFAPFEANYDGDVAHAISLLRSRFPWNDFVDQVIDYFQSRQAQLERSVAAAGGRDSIVNALAEEVQQRERNREFAMKRESLTAAGATPKKKGFGAKALRERQQRRSLQAPPQSAPVAQMVVEPAEQQPAATAPAADDYVLQQDEDEPEPTASERARSTLAHIAGFKDLQRQNASKGKQRLIDRQPTAQRVPFDSQEDGSQFQLPQSSTHARATQNPHKRPYVEDDDEPEAFEPTQDQGFQVDQRDTAAADARRRAAEASHASTHHRPQRSGTVDYDIPASSAKSPTRNRQSQTPKRQRKNPGSTFPDIPRPTANDPVEASNYDYQRAKDLAKLNRMTASQGRPPQVRTPWTAEEEDALIDLIVQHGDGGISYSALKKQADASGVLERRRPEDMRFKARNMKVTYLLGTVPLPENFENVILDRKAIDRLHAQGVPYQQDRIRNSGAEFE